MSIQSKNDFYLTVLLEHKKEDLYCAKLLCPIEMKPGEKVQVALCDISYEGSSTEFQNGEDAIFDIAIPKYCSTSMFGGVGDDNGNNWNEESLYSNGWKNGPYQSTDITFIRSRLENCEYTGATLCESMNREIKSKLPAAFEMDQCRFMLNESSNKIELRIDGSSNIPPRDRVTLVIYSPLSYYLGLIDYISPRATFCFVSRNQLSMN